MAKKKPISAVAFSKATLSKLSPSAMDLVNGKSLDSFLRSVSSSQLSKLSKRDLLLLGREAGRYYNKRVAALERAGFTGQSYREGGPKRIKEVRLVARGGKKETSRRQAYKDIMYAREQAYSRVGTPAKAKEFINLQKKEAQKRTEKLPFKELKGAKRVIDPTSGRQIMVDKDITEYNNMPIIDYKASDFGSAAEEKRTGFERFDRVKDAIKSLIEEEGAIYDSGRAVLAYMRARKNNMITHQQFETEMTAFLMDKRKTDPNYKLSYRAGVKELTTEEAYYYGMYKSETGNPADYWKEREAERERTRKSFISALEDDEDDDDEPSGFYK